MFTFLTTQAALDRLDEDDVVSDVLSRLLRIVSPSILANTFIPYNPTGRRSIRVLIGWVLSVLGI